MKKRLLSVALIGGLAVTSLGTHQAFAASGTSVVNKAQQGIGQAYSWGNNDCSGFTLRVFSQLGIQLPHNAAAQAGYGTAVSRSDLQPGDLVFFNTSGSGISHVGIYVGNNRMISSENENTGVRETQIFGGGASSYWAPRYVTARRIVTSSQPAVQQSSSSTQTKESIRESQSSSTQTSTNQGTSDVQQQQSTSTNQTASSDQPKAAVTAQTETSNPSDSASTPSSNVTQKHSSTSNAAVKVSKKAKTITAHTNNGVYIVQAGDTLWAISNHNGISVKKIQQINKLNGSLIKPGQKILLQSPSKKYTIKSGDTLWAIAKAHGITVEQLMKINHLSSDKIFPDQLLTISK
ncbi:LysM peptidoglycan-binding domain-containing protein [Sporolactobacillus kofuensis]|uniref:LysM peptidoglycan-binding domain-containing protein n=1 Tax=Sporolactobacillus kofuensis TaxID=269672 RepID=A0ABW1WG83_9BACL|nr:LysM peptidoglycan-binding domain-containing protein [Sporolactobacillus kofuensis]MCO7175742.1 LysM peptidoglycan-binding domain-containing protein [Sporolactobacillus kofuensis]